MIQLMPTYRIILILFITLLLQDNVVAQLQIFPNQTNYKTTFKSHYPITKTKNGILNLPFFDDFSTYIGLADTSLWLNQSGILVNTEFGINPISYGVATFDGYDQFGEPYEFSTVELDAVGLTDSLVSKPINLATWLPADSLYLSFFWQHQGLGEMPDLVDSLRVQFKDNTGNWTTVWSKTGAATADFALAMIPVRDAKYFYPEFQMQFQAFGRLSGLYDAWHLDYIYLNEGRNRQDIYSEDVAISQTPNFFLKRYTAMPLSQYFFNPNFETSASFITTINNLGTPPTFDSPLYSIIVRDTVSNFEFYRIRNDTINLISAQTFQKKIGLPIPKDLLIETSERLVLENKFILETGDNNLTVPGINFKRNDTLSSYTVLDDYYAYDDGSAEYGAGINQRFGQAAIRFVLNEADTLTDVNFHLTKFEKDLTGQTFNLVVWKKIGVKDSVLYKVNVPIRYPQERNGFISVVNAKQLSDPTFRFPLIPIVDTFYVGWEQTTNDRMTVGYDRNNNSTENIFFNAGNAWLPFDVGDEEKGSLMFRPVFGRDVITANEENEVISFQVFPNPSNGNMRIKGNLLESIEIYDLLGRKVFERKNNAYQPIIDINATALTNGMYILKVKNKQQKTAYQRILIEK